MYTDKFILLSRQRAKGKKLRNSSYLQKGARHVRSLIPRILGYSRIPKAADLCVRSSAKPQIFLSSRTECLGGESDVDVRPQVLEDQLKVQAIEE